MKTKPFITGSDKISLWKVLVGLILLTAALFGGAWARQPVEKVMPFNAPLTILSEGQFVYGPNVTDFDLSAYLSRNSSALAPLAQDLDDKASYYSINPRVLLTILEIRNGVVTAESPLTEKQLAHIVGYQDIVGYDEQVFKLCETLMENYYHRLYQQPLANTAVITLTLNDGTSVSVPATTNAGTTAILTSLAPLSSQEQWQALISKEEPTGFFQTYRRLFTEDDPLDDSNQVIAPEAPPATLLKFPFACNDTWNFSSGPHDGDCNPPFVAVDFAPGVGDCNVIPTDRWIVSPASGTVSAVNCGGCEVRITHQDGWGSFLFHVANPQVSVGETVLQNDPVGNPSMRPTCGGSCGGCGGSATGTHVHYALMYNGAFVAIEGTAFEGWVVHGTICRQGYLEKDGQQIWVGTPVPSEDCGGCCGCGNLQVGSESTLLSPLNQSSGFWFNPYTLVPTESVAVRNTKVPPSEPTESPELYVPTSVPFQSELVELQRTPPTSAHYRIPKSVLGSSGGLKSSTHYVMQGTSGQTTGVAWRQSDSYTLHSGYWGNAASHAIYLPLILKQS
jgi:LasA protease